MTESENRWEKRQQRWEERKLRWESKMQRHNRHGHIWTGLIILIIGVAALLKAVAVPLPYWLFTWPMILIIIGFISGVKCGFRNFSWLFFILIGGAFLTGYIVPDIEYKKFIWPSVLILIGLAFILRPRRRRLYNEKDTIASEEKKTTDLNDTGESSVILDVKAGWESDETQSSTEDILDTTSIFGGIKKNVLSKNFKGGDITNIMGGTELNFSQADIKGEVILDMTQIFGGTKIVVPADWDVKSDIVAIFGGIEDKRSLENISINPSKVLLLKGTSIFAGIEIRNF